MYRFKKEKEKERLKKIAQIFRTKDAIDAAIRSQGYILDKYKGSDGNKVIGEIEKLIGIQEALQNANDLLCHWCDFSPREIWSMEEKISAIVESLMRCSNIYKILARERMESFTGIQDSRERVNPSAIAAKTAAAIADIIRRSNEVDRLLVVNAIKQQILEVEKLHEEMNIKHACWLLKAAIASSDKTLLNYGMIEQKINRALYYLQSDWANPYFTRAMQAKEIVNLGKKYCREEKLHLARIVFSAAVVTLD